MWRSLFDTWGMISGWRRLRGNNGMETAPSAIRKVTFGLKLECEETHNRGKELSRQEESQGVVNTV